jgi:hypothetical protein
MILSGLNRIYSIIIVLDCTKCKNLDQPLGKKGTWGGFRGDDCTAMFKCPDGLAVSVDLSYSNLLSALLPF